MRRTLILALALTTTASISTRAQVVKLWPGVAPGSEHWTQREVTIENTPVGTVVMNVVTPTLTLFLPDAKSATGTGVIVAPGGAFVALATSREGTEVARWLQRRGIAAFLLKYRAAQLRGDHLRCAVRPDAVHSREAPADLSGMGAG